MFIKIIKINIIFLIKIKENINIKKYKNVIKTDLLNKIKLNKDIKYLKRNL